MTTEIVTTILTIISALVGLASVVDWLRGIRKYNLQRIEKDIIENKEKSSTKKAVLRKPAMSNKPHYWRLIISLIVDTAFLLFWVFLQSFVYQKLISFHDFNASNAFKKGFAAIFFLSTLIPVATFIVHDLKVALRLIKK